MMGSDMPFPIGDLDAVEDRGRDASFTEAERQSINGGLATKLFG